MKLVFLRLFISTIRFFIDELSKYNDLNPMNQLLKNMLTNVIVKNMAWTA